MIGSKSRSGTDNSGRLPRQEREPYKTSALASVPWDYTVALGYSRKPLIGRFDNLIRLYPVLKNVQQREARLETSETSETSETWKLDETAVAFRRVREDEDEKSAYPSGPQVDLRGTKGVFWFYRHHDSGTMERLAGLAGQQIECGYQWIKEQNYAVPAVLRCGVNATEGVYRDRFDRHKLAYRVCPAVEKDKQHVAVYEINARTGYQQLLIRSPPETTPLFDEARLALFPESQMSAPALSSADLRRTWASHPADFQVFLVPYEEEKRIDLIVSGGSTPNGQNWETLVFCLELEALDETMMDMILSPPGRKTMFRLEPHAGGRGHHNSVVVLANDDIRAHLRRVEMNVCQFVNRPLLEPCEVHCESQSRMFEYAEMMCDHGLCVLAAATTTRCYFGAAFDRTFRSHKHFCDSLVSTLGQGLKYAVADMNKLCRVAGDLITQTNDVTGYDRQFYYVLGGDRPGGFESVLGEPCVFEYARKYTRSHEGALVLTVYPRDHLSRVHIFQDGQFRVLRLDQVRDATPGFCRLQIGTLVNDCEVMCVNRFLVGSASYCVRSHQTSESELQVKRVCDLCS